MTKSAYIRDLILFGQTRKAEDKNYENVIYELNKLVLISISLRTSQIRNLVQMESRYYL